MRCPTLAELPSPPAGKIGWPWTEESPQREDGGQAASLPYTPRVSIVTPSYNQAQFLEETIRSVLLQGYPDLEYMIIDGGSTDGSVEIICKYEPWLAYWVSEKDRGQSHALNKGFERATGYILAWLNSDDFYLPGTVGRAVNCLERHPDAGMVSGGLEIIDENSNLTDNWPSQPFAWQNQLFVNRIWQPSTFFTARALRDVGPLDESLHCAMDYDLWLRIALAYGAEHIEDSLARFRYWPASKSSSQPLRFALEMELVIDRFFAQPVVPPEARAIEDLARARVRWMAGLLLEEDGKLTEALPHILSALDGHGLVKLDATRACQELLYWPSGRLRSEGRLSGILDNLDLQSRELGSFASAVWAHYHAIRSFEGFRESQPRVVRRHFPRALVHDLRWLRNRGFLKIAAWSLVGRAAQSPTSDARDGDRSYEEVDGSVIHDEHPAG